MEVLLDLVDDVLLVVLLQVISVRPCRAPSTSACAVPIVVPANHAVEMLRWHVHAVATAGQ